MHEDLVYDVGAHHGHDTAYYLSLGYRVIAIEAYPESVTILERRFHGEIQDGRLTIVAKAVGPDPGPIEMFVSGSSTGSNSLLADEVDDVAEVILVPCITFSEVLDEFGVPYYLKVDIQGRDRHVLDSLDARDTPAVISWEMDRDQLECLRRVRELGFRRFKLIDQHTFLEMSRKFSYRYRLARKLHGIVMRGNKNPRVASAWVFPSHSSGPFGDSSDGRWRTYEEVEAQWQRFVCRFPTRREQPGWFDCHAAK